MKKAALLVMMMCYMPVFGAWEMFSDGGDTYLYNTQNGDVYIRYKRGGKNYEDVFVKMPAGVLPSQLNPNPPSKPSAQSNNDKARTEAFQKSQELLRNSIDASSLLQ